MKHSFIYKLIYFISSKIYTYYCESTTRKVMNKIFLVIGNIYRNSIIHKIMSINNEKTGMFIESSCTGKVMKLINIILGFFKRVYERGINGSRIVKLDKSLLSDIDSKENRKFIAIICIGVLVSYSALKVVNGAFSMRTIIFDVMIVGLTLSIYFIKMGTTITNSAIFRLAKGFLIQPRGDENE